MMTLSLINVTDGQKYKGTFATSDRLCDGDAKLPIAAFLAVDSHPPPISISVSIFDDVYSIAAFSRISGCCTRFHGPNVENPPIAKLS